MEWVRAGSDFERAASELLRESLADRLRQKSRVSLALSGGSTPWPILRTLADADLDWTRVDVFQVDERVAPEGDPARNLVGIRTALLDHVPATVFPMPVDVPDLDEAVAAYDHLLPPTIDVVHLGLGEDGHTASLVPGDPVLDLVDRRVAITEPYRGHRRMTLTYPTLETSGAIIWIVSGARKAAMTERLRSADPTIPAGRVTQTHARLVTDFGAT
ncbi:MAG: 6-phosphogluconolactonase [Polyangiales bacterium]